MPEENATDAVQPETQPVSDSAPVVTDQAKETGNWPDGEAFDPERAKATIEKLRGYEKEAAQLRKKMAVLEKAEHDRKEAELSELEKAQSRLAELEAKAAKLERLSLQREVAERVGLPAVLATRLQGETDDDMEADAKLLMESLPKEQKAKTTIPATNPGINASANETHAQQKARLLGTGEGDPFSADIARSKGGGVYFNEGA